MSIISRQEYSRLALLSGRDSSHELMNGYAALPKQLLEAEHSVTQKDPLAAYNLNKFLCNELLKAFALTDTCWVLPGQFQSLYQQHLLRIESQLREGVDTYFSLDNDPFRKDLAILRHRLIPFGAELATPFSGISRRLLIRKGVRQAAKFICVVASARGFSPFLELHMHPHYTATFNQQGWLDTYENLADFLAVNPSLLGVQSTSWFLDPALEEVSPHLTYLRQVPERSGATFLYAGEDDYMQSGAFATSQTRRALFKTGSYHPRLFTRIWPRRKLLQRSWRLL